MRNFVLVFLGGGLGSGCRYLTILGVHRWFHPQHFPLGVLVANLAGCFVLGLAVAAAPERFRESPWWLMSTTGFLGGYTTFSTWCNDSWILFSNGQSTAAWLNAIGSMVLGIVMVAGGWTLGKNLIHG